MSSYPRFQWDSIQSLAIPDSKILALASVSALCIMACAPFYDDRRLWFDGEEPVTDEQWDEISKALGLMEHEIMSGLIGAIIPHVRHNLTGLNLLPCDGSVYMREDYPLLYEAIDTIYIIDADTFRVPDMREKFPLGEGGDWVLDDTGGEAEHELTVDEMPAHSHGFTQYTFGVDIESVGVPDPTGVGNPRLPESTDASGGGEPHNNMPPYIVVRWAIVSG